MLPFMFSLHKLIEKCNSVYRSRSILNDFYSLSTLSFLSFSFLGYYFFFFLVHNQLCFGCIPDSTFRYHSWQLQGKPNWISCKASTLPTVLLSLQLPIFSPFHYLLIVKHRVFRKRWTLGSLPLFRHQRAIKLFSCSTSTQLIPQEDMVWYFYTLPQTR